VVVAGCVTGSWRRRDCWDANELERVEEAEGRRLVAVDLEGDQGAARQTDTAARVCGSARRPKKISAWNLPGRKDLSAGRDGVARRWRSGCDPGAPSRSTADKPATLPLPQRAPAHSHHQQSRRRQEPGHASATTTHQRLTRRRAPSSASPMGWCPCSDRSRACRRRRHDGYRDGR